MIFVGFRISQSSVLQVDIDLNIYKQDSHEFEHTRTTYAAEAGGRLALNVSGHDDYYSGISTGCLVPAEVTHDDCETQLITGLDSHSIVPCILLLLLLKLCMVVYVWWCVVCVAMWCCDVSNCCSAQNVGCKMTSSDRIAQQLKLTDNSSPNCSDVNKWALQQALDILGKSEVGKATLAGFKAKGRGIFFADDFAPFENIGPLFVKGNIKIADSSKVCSVWVPAFAATMRV